MTATDILFLCSQAVWLVVSILLLVHLKVFAPRSLAQAPVRRGQLSVMVPVAAFLLYMGLAVLGQTAVMSLARGLGEAGVTGTRPSVKAALTRPAAGDPVAARAPAAPPATQAATRDGAGTATTQARADVLSLVVDNAINAFAEVPAAALIVLLCGAMVRRDGKQSGVSAWGLGWKKLAPGVGLGLLGVLVVYPLLEAVNWGVAAGIELMEHRVQELHPTIQAMEQSPAAWEQVMLVIFAAVVAPVVEELFFRGALQAAFMQPYWGFLPATEEGNGGRYRPSVAHRWGAIVVVSAMFAAVHGADSAAVIFVLALGLGYVYERTGNLWASIVMHAAFNGVNLYMAKMAG